MVPAFSRNLVFFHGKGGTGKTTLSLALALLLARQGKETLWVTVEDPLSPPGELRPIEPHLSRLNCEFIAAFEEYAGLKIGSPRLTRLFLRNQVLRYLIKAAPGVRELVLLGKIWYERKHYHHVVVDLPSTGHGLAMFQSTENFARLFKGGPLHRDAQAMLETFQKPELTGHVIVSLPEEMPLQESCELQDHLARIVPGNAPTHLINRVFPALHASESAHLPSGQEPTAGASLLPRDLSDYLQKRGALEEFHLQRFCARLGIKSSSDADHRFGGLSLAYHPLPLEDSAQILAEALALEMRQKGYA